MIYDDLMKGLFGLRYLDILKDYIHPTVRHFKNDRFAVDHVDNAAVIRVLRKGLNGKE